MVASQDQEGLPWLLAIQVPKFNSKNKIMKEHLT